MKLKVTVDGASYDVEVEVEEDPTPALGPLLIASTSAYGVTPVSAKAPANPANGVTAPISGTVVKVLVEPDAHVATGDTLMVLEAMKMETEITAPHDGTIGIVVVGVGDAVSSGQVLLEWA
ncbi:MAG TPA: biotin/lipoyl-containing protein [Dermatophilaceae bacterium]|nr:biotin/lipoyl-containing protein [Dermatophilaceae bacterium]